ncbi:MAG: alpha/beta hydrolase [Pseudomonadota bacterium]
MPVLPERIAFQFAVLLASLSQRSPLKPEDQAVLDAATQFEFGRGIRRVGWRWGSGPKVVLAHGWGGRAGQMVKMADAIAAAGFEVVVFDGQSHGESGGRRIGFRKLTDDLNALDAALKSNIAAWVCHSAAGLCLAAARIRFGLSPKRIVCLATPRGPYIPVRELDQHLKLRSGVLERCRAFYAGEFGMSWQEMDRCAAFIHRGDVEMLLIQDRDDPRVEDGDAERIAEAWGNAKVVYTDGLGHVKLLWSDEVAQRVIEFLRSANS